METSYKTQFSLGISQTEQFANSLSGEYVVTKGVSGTVTQKLFSSVNLAFTGGYATQNFVNLSSENIPGQSSNQLPSSYYYGSLSLYWRIEEWVNFVNSLTVNSGQQQAASGGGNHPQYLYSIGLNFSL